MRRSLSILTHSLHRFMFCFLLFRLLNSTESKKANHIHLFFISCTKALKDVAYLIFSLLFVFFILKYWAVFYTTVLAYQLTKPVFSLFLLLAYNLLNLEKQIFLGHFSNWSLPLQPGIEVLYETWRGLGKWLCHWKHYLVISILFEVLMVLWFKNILCKCL